MRLMTDLFLGKSLHEITVRVGTDLEYSPEMRVVMFKDFSIVVKILIPTSLLNYLQGSPLKVLKTGEVPRLVSYLLGIYVCV